MATTIVGRKQRGSRSKYRPENLVYLVRTSGGSGSRALEECPEGVTIDFAQGTWSFKGCTLAIGNYALFFSGEKAPIGVFDMTRSSQETTLLRVRARIERENNQ